MTIEMSLILIWVSLALTDSPDPQTPLAPGDLILHLDQHEGRTQGIKLRSFP